MRPFISNDVIWKRPGGLKVLVLESELLLLPFSHYTCHVFWWLARELSGKEGMEYPSHAPHKMSGQHSWLTQRNG